MLSSRPPTASRLGGRLGSPRVPHRGLVSFRAPAKTRDREGILREREDGESDPVSFHAQRDSDEEASLLTVIDGMLSVS